MTQEEMKQWIDNASYKELLSRWRFDPIGSPWFVGDVGRHYTKTIVQRKAEVGHNRAVDISKSLGFGED